jgi:hypothetical protein
VYDALGRRVHLRHCLVSAAEEERVVADLRGPAHDLLTGSGYSRRNAGGRVLRVRRSGREDGQEPPNVGNREA